MLTLDALNRPGPSFDEPLEMLVACHDKIRQFCTQLERLPTYIAEHGVNDAVRTTIDGVVRYFDQAGPAHHLDEEEELFPILLARVPDAAPKLEQLSGEHGYLHSRWNAIRDELLALKNGNISAISRIEVAEFTRLYREHAAIEEAWMIPIAATVLTDEEKRAAGHRMAARRQAPHA